VSKILTGFKKLLRREHGQALPAIGIMLGVVLACGGIAIDVGRALYSYEQLQASTDAAALAGAYALPSATAVTVATQYSSVAGSLNAYSTLTGVKMVSGYPKVECLTTLSAQGEACVAPENGNAMHVEQTVQLPMYFLALVGKSSLTLTASATASMRGSSPIPYNIAIIMDTTLSMLEEDSNCGNTQMQCALNGVQILLQSMSACQSNTGTCTIANGVSTNPIDSVALFTFPNVSAATAVQDVNCTNTVPSSYTISGTKYDYTYEDGMGYIVMPTSSTTRGVTTYSYNNAYPYIATAQPYTFPTAGATSYAPGTGATYQITKFDSDFKTTTNTTTLNTASDIVQGAGGESGCGGMAPSNYDGVVGTYYAGAIYAAQAALVAQQKTNPGSQNVIIILSDGDANSPQTSFGWTSMNAGSTGTYPSYKQQCHQGITAAAAATAAGTRVYTVAYGSPSTGCVYDTSPTMSPCTAMQEMASSTQYFFSDYLQSGSGSTCYSDAQPVTSLAGIFTQIANDLTNGRLIPDSTQ